MDVAEYETLTYISRGSTVVLTLDNGGAVYGEGTERDTINSEQYIDTALHCTNRAKYPDLHPRSLHYGNEARCSTGNRLLGRHCPRSNATTVQRSEGHFNVTRLRFLKQAATACTFRLK